MADFRAQPIPTGILDEYIRAKSKSPLSSAIGGLSSGMERGLALTEEIAKIKQAKEKQSKLAEVASNPETRATLESLLGSGGADIFYRGMYEKPDEAMKTLADLQIEGAKTKSREQDVANRKAYYAGLYKNKSKDDIDKNVDNLFNWIKEATYGTMKMRPSDTRYAEFLEKKAHYDAALEKQGELVGAKTGGAIPKTTKIQVVLKHDMKGLDGTIYKKGEIGNIPESEFNDTDYSRK